LIGGVKCCAFCKNQSKFRNQKNRYSYEDDEYSSSSFFYISLPSLSICFYRSLVEQGTDKQCFSVFHQHRAAATAAATATATATATAGRRSRRRRLCAPASAVCQISAMDSRRI
jgi:hypothetical protein